MTPTTEAPTAAGRLRTLLLDSELNEAILVHARALGPATAGEVVAALVEANCSPDAENRAGLRAAHLARALGLERAVPALVRCVASLGEADPLWNVAIETLAPLGAPATDAVLAAFHAAGDTGVRCRLAQALVRSSPDDTRVRVALVDLLDEAPAIAARCLAERGDWRAVPDLVEAFERLVDHPIADCLGCALEHLATIDRALHLLGAPASASRQAEIDALDERFEKVPLSVPGPLPGSRAPVLRVLRVGRNDRCPCGSGKKYKHCCADRDVRRGAH